MSWLAVWLAVCEQESQMSQTINIGNDAHGLPITKPKRCSQLENLSLQFWRLEKDTDQPIRGIGTSQSCIIVMFCDKNFYVSDQFAQEEFKKWIF